MSAQSKYPEHEKLALISDKSQEFGEFLDWMRSVKRIQFVQEIEACVVDQVRIADDPSRPEKWGWSEVLSTAMVFLHIRIEDLLAEFFDIDQDKIQAEKEQMLQEIRDAYKARMEPEASTVQPG